jgi:AcrR family transcriptional regulator
MTTMPGRVARERSNRTSRDEQKKRTRLRVYEAAKELFKEKGYLQTRTADIAKRAGVSQGAVHAHFQSKSDILSALMVDYLEQVDAEMATFQPNSHNSIEAFCEAVLLIADIHARNIDQVGWYYGYAWIWADEEEHHYRRLMGSLRQRFSKILEDGVARGQILAEAPIGLICDLVRGYYRAHLRELRFGEDTPEDFKARLGPCVELLLGQYRGSQG